MQDARLPKVSAVDEALAAGTDDDGLDQDEMIAELSEQLGALAAFEPEQKRAAEPKSGILSEQAGRQVAASFGELTEAFSSNRRRSFEEMAEEMMRPMLQDWLDNNLPVLVERLVREEIERVARGASS
jgi:cell pole-organizing protein PopZ